MKSQSQSKMSAAHLRTSLLSSLILCAVIVGAMTFAADRPQDAALDKDLRFLMTLFPGVYDNQEQVYFEEEQEVPEALRHERIHHVFTRVDLPAFGENVLYVQQHQNDDPAQIYRQRIYVFTPDYDEGAIRLTIHTPLDVEALVDSHMDPGKLDGLSPQQTKVTPGCEVYWKRMGDQFTGYMHEGKCSFVSSRSGKKITIYDDLILSATELWISDRALDEDGNLVFGHKAAVPHKNRKARPFECWISIRHEDGSFDFHSKLKTHDQGGLFWVTTDEPTPQKVGIKLRNVVWPYGTNKPSLVMYAYRDIADKAVSYAWAEPDANRLGLNLRWVQGSCTHKPRSPF